MSKSSFYFYKDQLAKCGITNEQLHTLESWLVGELYSIGLDGRVFSRDIISSLRLDIINLIDELCLIGHNVESFRHHVDNYISNKNVGSSVVGYTRGDDDADISDEWYLRKTYLLKHFNDKTGLSDNESFKKIITEFLEKFYEARIELKKKRRVGSRKHRQSNQPHERYEEAFPSLSSTCDLLATVSQVGAALNWAAATTSSTQDVTNSVANAQGTNETAANHRQKLNPDSLKCAYVGEMTVGGKQYIVMRSTQNSTTSGHACSQPFKKRRKRRRHARYPINKPTPPKPRQPATQFHPPSSGATNRLPDDNEDDGSDIHSLIQLTKDCSKDKIIEESPFNYQLFSIVSMCQPLFAIDKRIWKEVDNKVLPGGGRERDGEVSFDQVGADLGYPGRDDQMPSAAALWNSWLERNNEEGSKNKDKNGGVDSVAVEATTPTIADGIGNFKQCDTSKSNYVLLADDVAGEGAALSCQRNENYDVGESEKNKKEYEEDNVNGDENVGNLEDPVSRDVINDVMNFNLWKGNDNNKNNDFRALGNYGFGQQNTNNNSHFRKSASLPRNILQPNVIGLNPRSENDASKFTYVNPPNAPILGTLTPTFDLPCRSPAFESPEQLNWFVDKEDEEDNDNHDNNHHKDEDGDNLQGCASNGVINDFADVNAQKGDDNNQINYFKGLENYAYNQQTTNNNHSPKTLPSKSILQPKAIYPMCLRSGNDTSKFLPTFINPSGLFRFFRYSFPIPATSTPTIDHQCTSPASESAAAVEPGSSVFNAGLQISNRFNTVRNNDANGCSDLLTSILAEVSDSSIIHNIDGILKDEESYNSGETEEELVKIMENVCEARCATPLPSFYEAAAMHHQLGAMQHQLHAVTSSSSRICANVVDDVTSCAADGADLCGGAVPELSTEVSLSEALLLNAAAAAAASQNIPSQQQEPIVTSSAEQMPPAMDSQQPGSTWRYDNWIFRQSNDTNANVINNNNVINQMEFMSIVNNLQGVLIKLTADRMSIDVNLTSLINIINSLLAAVNNNIVDATISSNINGNTWYNNNNIIINNNVIIIIRNTINNIIDVIKDITTNYSNNIDNIANNINKIIEINNVVISNNNFSKIVNDIISHINIINNAIINNNINNNINNINNTCLLVEDEQGGREINVDNYFNSAVTCNNSQEQQQNDSLSAQL
ncbi:hypothetical protein HELRODRAFT_192126 [Helobdella robusta]|uniref:Uncharacterized protein n=1 Tax=Helobdella robusta TaxID=6412 RepID=T1FTL7_HELRO|nr:hypothetical protein HELRODRAFT_192126 [Helobdella robusta]ESO03167.1 hypothetical protein HELRODRAFT_192126 [Helobdella robusta]